MTKDKIEEFVVVYETCPRSKFGPGRDCRGNLHKVQKMY